jgi:ankyrin repeat protein
MSPSANPLLKSLYSGPDTDPVVKMCYAIVAGDAVLASDAVAEAKKKGVDLVGVRDRDAPLAFRLIRPAARDSTVLHDACFYAAAHGHNQIVGLLLKAGADPNLQDVFGYRPLHQAAVTNNAAVCRMLLDAGADIDAQSNKGYTALHTAIYRRCNESSSILILRGASLRLTNERGQTPLDYAKDLNRGELMLRIQTATARRAAEKAMRKVRAAASRDER